VNVETYFENIPDLHTWDGGKTWTTGGFDREQLQAVYRFALEQGERLTFLETGAGNSTLVFHFLQPAEVISIAPDQDLFDRIAAVRDQMDLSSSVSRFIVDASEWALPRLAQERDSPFVDFALIDGEHNFPNVFLDFFYINYMLKPGGVIMVDDLQIYSCHLLARFLELEWDFERVLDLGKARIYRRTSGRCVLTGWKSGFNMAMEGKFQL